MADKDKPKAGRPTDYTKELGDKVFLGLSAGKSLRTICDEDDMPNRSTLFRWLSDSKHPFCDQYARGREVQAEAMFDDMLDIADDGTNDWVERETERGSYVALNSEAIQRSKLRLDARKWAASKILPKKYGDRIQQDITLSPLEEMTDEQLEKTALTLVGKLGIDPSAIAGLGQGASGKGEEAE